MSDEEYEELHDVISMERFNFLTWRIDEIDILTPRLQEKGFRDIAFHMGEEDSFGPLTRIVTCVDADDNKRRFIYG